MSKLQKGINAIANFSQLLNAEKFVKICFCILSKTFVTIVCYENSTAACFIFCLFWAIVGMNLFAAVFLDAFFNGKTEAEKMYKKVIANTSKPNEMCYRIFRQSPPSIPLTRILKIP